MPQFTEFLNTENLVAVLGPILLAFVTAYFLGALISYIYRRMYTGAVYNHAFAVSLSVMTIITTMITLSISSNIALSLGMVGALSIVRYRTAIKDPVDILFLFWAVGTGVAIGAKQHYLAVIGAVIVILTFITLSRKAVSNEVYVMIIHFSGNDAYGNIQRVLKGIPYSVKSRTDRQETVELALEVVVKNRNTTFVDGIKTIEGVKDVVLIQYAGEYVG